MAKYDWNAFRNYVAFLAGRMAPGTSCPHHDSELTSCYHDAFLPWGHYHNNIVLFYHDSPVTRSYFMDPTDRAIKGFYCITISMIQIWPSCCFYVLSTARVRFQTGLKSRGGCATKNCTPKSLNCWMSATNLPMCYASAESWGLSELNDVRVISDGIPERISWTI